MHTDENSMISGNESGTFGQRKRTVPILFVLGPMNEVTVETDKLPPEKWLVNRKRKTVHVYEKTDELTYTFSPARSLHATENFHWEFAE